MSKSLDLSILAQAASRVKAKKLIVSVGLVCNGDGPPLACYTITTHDHADDAKNARACISLKGCYRTKIAQGEGDVDARSLFTLVDQVNAALE